MKFDELLEACHARLQLHVAFDSHGCAYSGKDPIALAVIELLGEAFACGFEPPNTDDPGIVTILDGSEDPQPAYQFTPPEARMFAAKLMRAADEAEAEATAKKL